MVLIAHGRNLLRPVNTYDVLLKTGTVHTNHGPLTQLIHPCCVHTVVDTHIYILYSMSQIASEVWYNIGVWDIFSRLEYFQSTGKFQSTGFHLLKFSID